VEMIAAFSFHLQLWEYLSHFEVPLLADNLVSGERERSDKETAEHVLTIS
jgi:hypothetical protein